MYSNEGYYMSNALSSEDYAESIILIFNENNVGAPNTYPRYRGYSVRPVYVPEPIAQIGETIYTDVDAFITAYYAIEGTASVKLLDDITLPEDDFLIVKADPKRLSRVFENLISNAFNYTNEDAVIAIALSARASLAVYNKNVESTPLENATATLPNDCKYSFNFSNIIISNRNNSFA